MYVRIYINTAGGFSFSVVKFVQIRIYSELSEMLKTSSCIAAEIYFAFNYTVDLGCVTIYDKERVHIKYARRVDKHIYM